MQHHEEAPRRPQVLSHSGKTSTRQDRTLSICGEKQASIRCVQTTCIYLTIQPSEPERVMSHGADSLKPPRAQQTPGTLGACRSRCRGAAWAAALLRPPRRRWLCWAEERTVCGKNTPMAKLTPFISEPQDPASPPPACGGWRSCPPLAWGPSMCLRPHDVHTTVTIPLSQENPEHLGITSDNTWHPGDP